MEEINLKELFDYFKERLLTIIAIILVVLIIGSVYSIFIKTPLYQSTASIVLVSDDGQAGGNQSYTTSDLQLNQNLVSTYSEIVTSRKIVDTVIDNLSLEYTTEELQDNIVVTNKDDTEIINITVTDEDKSLAADIANEIVKVFGEEIKNIYKLQNVSTIDVAEEAEEPYNINIVKDLLIYLAIGIVLSCGIIFVIYYFDTTIKSAEEIETKLELPVIGVVPKIKHREKK